MSSLKDGVKTMPRGVVPGDRWAILEKTSPSGKTMFRCMSCGQEDVAPRKTCWIETKTVNNDTGFPNGREINVECMVWMPVKLFRYYLPNEQPHGEGWAYFVLSNDGYFSTVSDYGNYSFYWSHHGTKDFRIFLLRAQDSWDYFAAKLSNGREYSGRHTYENVRDHILQSRKEAARAARDNGNKVHEGRWTKEYARQEWDLLKDHESLATIADFTRWGDRTELDESWEFYAERYPGDVEAFCKKTLKRLGEVLQLDLVREGLIERTPEAAVHA